MISRSLVALKKCCFPLWSLLVGWCVRRRSYSISYSIMKRSVEFPSYCISPVCNVLPNPFNLMPADTKCFWLCSYTAWTVVLRCAKKPLCSACFFSLVFTQLRSDFWIKVCVQTLLSGQASALLWMNVACSWISLEVLVFFLNCTPTFSFHVLINLRGFLSTKWRPNLPTFTKCSLDN